MLRVGLTAVVLVAVGLAAVVVAVFGWERSAAFQAAFVSAAPPVLKDAERSFEATFAAFEISRAAIQVSGVGFEAAWMSQKRGSKLPLSTLTPRPAAQNARSRDCHCELLAHRALVPLAGCGALRARPATFGCCSEHGGRATGCDGLGLARGRGVCQSKRAGARHSRHVRGIRRQRK